MAKLEIKLLLGFDEMNTNVRALQQWRKVQVFNVQGIASTDEERKEAATEVFRVEGILRQLGIEPDKLTNTEEGKARGGD